MAQLPTLDSFRQSIPVYYFDGKPQRSASQSGGGGAAASGALIAQSAASLLD